MRLTGIRCLLVPLLSALPAAAAELGDATRGAAVFAACESCHMVGPEARHRVGPHLNGLFGRAAAGLADYRYSAEMARAGADGLVWRLDTLDSFLEAPRAVVTGSRMSFAGVAAARDRADLLAYLRSFSDSPQNIPEAPPTASAREVDLDPSILAIAGDPDYGEYLSSECTTCHQASGADEGIPSITGWPLADFVYAMHAYKAKVRPNPVMQLMAGKLSNEEIAALAAYFRGVD